MSAGWDSESETWLWLLSPPPSQPLLGIKDQPSEGPKGPPYPPGWASEAWPSLPLPTGSLLHSKSSCHVHEPSVPSHPCASAHVGPLPDIPAPSRFCPFKPSLSFSSSPPPRRALPALCPLCSASCISENTYCWHRCSGLGTRRLVIWLARWGSCSLRAARLGGDCALWCESRAREVQLCPQLSG